MMASVIPELSTDVRVDLLGHRRSIWRSVRQMSLTTWLSLGAIAAIVCLVAIGPLIIPFPADQISLSGRLHPPSFLPGGTLTHVLGTDNLGRDELSRLLVGGRTSLVVGLSAVC